jgi:hydrogenase maturation factor
VCIARVGKVLRVRDGKGRVEFFDGRTLEGVVLSVARAEAGDYVEVFGDLALSVLSPDEARRRRSAWREVRAASL